MSKRFRRCFASSIALFCSWAGARLACAETQDPPAELAVGIHNYAGVPHATLKHSQEQVTEVFDAFASSSYGGLTVHHLTRRSKSSAPAGKS